MTRFNTWLSFAERRHVWSIAAIAVFTIVYWLFALRIPFNMDEAIHYQPLACLQYPFAKFHEFREACGEKDLYLFSWLPLRSFTYAGSLSNLGFFPFWLLLNDQVSLRLFSFLFCATNLILISRILKTPLWLVVLSFGVFPPFLFQHVIDTGPVSWQIFWGLAGTLLLARAFESLFSVADFSQLSRTAVLRSYLLTVMSAFSFFVALEQKMFGIFFFPFFFCLLIFRWRSVRFSISKDFLKFGSVALSLIVWNVSIVTSLMVTLLSLETRAGVSYGSVIRNSSSRLTLNEGVLLFERMFHFFLHYISQPSQYVHRIYMTSAGDWYRPVNSFGQQWSEASSDPMRFWPLGATFVLVFLILLFRRLAFYWCLGFLAAGVFMVAVVAHVRYSWAGHHIVVAHIFLPLAMLSAVSCLKGMRAALVCLLFGFISAGSLLSVARLDDSQVNAHSSRSRDELFHWLDDSGFAEKHMLVHTNWGTYYLDALFGPRSQLVVYIEPFREEAHFERVATIAGALGRKVAFVGRSNASPEWQRFLSSNRFGAVKVSSDGLWSVWSVQ